MQSAENEAGRVRSITGVADVYQKAGDTSLRKPKQKRRLILPAAGRLDVQQIQHTNNIRRSAAPPRRRRRLRGKERPPQEREEPPRVAAPE